MAYPGNKRINLHTVALPNKKRNNDGMSFVAELQKKTQIPFRVVVTKMGYIYG